MSSLIVSLPIANASVSGGELPYALVSDSALLTDAGVAVQAKWPKASELVVQVPAQQITWLQVDLPKPGKGLPANKLRAVLEGLVEEQVLVDVATLHLALPAQAPGGEKTWVAACDKAWLSGWLQRLEVQGRAAHRIVPEAEPQETARLHFSGSTDTVQWVYADAQGVLCAPLAYAAALLPSDWAQAQISASPAAAAAAQKMLGDSSSGGGSGIHMVQNAAYLAQALGSAWNLGQFDLATSGSGRVWQRFLRGARQLAFAPDWRWARAGLVLLVLAQLLGINVWAWQERQALDAQKKQLRAAVTALTGATYISDNPVGQAEQKRQALRQATGALGAADAEAMLAVLATGLPAMPEGSELQYEGQVLRLRGSTLAADALQNLRSAARAAGYQVLTVGDTLEISPEARRQAQPAAQSQPASTTPAASPAAPAAVVSRLSSFIWQT
jgi:general secretion pathway protein L